MESNDILSWVALSGGLGNQVFQYIFARYAEETAGYHIVLDDLQFFLYFDEIAKNKAGMVAPFDKIIHNGYELEYVFPNLKKPLLLSERYNKNEFFQALGRAKNGEWFPHQLIRDGLNVTIIRETYDLSKRMNFPSNSTQYTPMYRYNSAVVKTRGNVYFYGNWLNQNYFNACRNKILEELSFRPIADTQNMRYEREIKSCFSIGVHIRRGDFVRHGLAMPRGAFADIITKLANRHPEAVFFIFSDEINWCKENYKVLGLCGKQAVFAEGNYDHRNNYIDIQLMSMCDVLVGCKYSSFSYLAALMNQKPDFYTVNIPKYSTNDIAPLYKKKCSGMGVYINDHAATIKKSIKRRKLVFWETGEMTENSCEGLDITADISAYTYSSLAIGEEDTFNKKPLIPVSSLSKDEHYVVVPTLDYEKEITAYLTARGFTKLDDCIIITNYPMDMC